MRDRLGRAQRWAPSGLVTEATVRGLAIYLPRAEKLRTVPTWAAEGRGLVANAPLQVLSRTPHRDGERALWLVQTEGGLRGYVTATLAEVGEGLAAAYLGATGEEASAASLLSALPEDTTPLAGGAPRAPSRAPWVAGAALALVAVGLIAWRSS